VHSNNDTILKTIKGESTSHTPVWFMRQAGRSQPEYRKLKEKYSLFEITHQPELCAYVTHLPVDNYNTDAAVLYKDIMTPLKPIGVDVEIKEEAVDPDDVEMLQDLVLAATNEAMNKADELTQERLGKHTQGLNIPGM